MAGYNNYFPQTYAGSYGNNSIGFNGTAATQTPSPTPQPTNGINWVQGEAGARSIPVQAGQKVILMDSETNIFYVKSSDQYGMPLPLRIFKYEEVGNLVSSNNGNVDYVTREEFEKAIESLKGKKEDNEKEVEKKNESFII